MGNFLAQYIRNPLNVVFRPFLRFFRYLTNLFFSAKKQNPPNLAPPDPAPP